MELTQEQRREVEAARDNFHRVILAVLKEHNVETDRDITEVGEELALEGRLFEKD